MGGNKLTREFLSDKLSWVWPITILAVPTILFGFSIITIESTNTSLRKMTFNSFGYSNLFFQENIQCFLWGIAFFLSAGTFYRYQRQRSKTTWFSKHWVFNLLRTMLFNFPLSYMILTTILVWIEFSLSLHQFLSDNNVYYSFLHPDMLYGLKTVYKTVLSMGGALTALSFLPTIMLIREKQEKYSKMYFFLVYSGIIALFIMFGLLVFRFDQRLGNIKESALNATQKQMTTDKADGDFQKVITDLQYYQIASSLPSGFPIPPWANTLLSVRSIVLVFEIIKLSSREFTKEALIKFLQHLIKV